MPEYGKPIYNDLHWKSTLDFFKEHENVGGGGLSEQAEPFNPDTPLPKASVTTPDHPEGPGIPLQDGFTAKEWKQMRRDDKKGVGREDYPQDPDATPVNPVLMRTVAERAREQGNIEEALLKLQKEIDQRLNAMAEDKLEKPEEEDILVADGEKTGDAMKRIAKARADGSIEQALLKLMDDGPFLDKAGQRPFEPMPEVPGDEDTLGSPKNITEDTLSDWGGTTSAKLNVPPGQEVPNTTPFTVTDKPFDPFDHRSEQLRTKMMEDILEGRREHGLSSDQLENLRHLVHRRKKDELSAAAGLRHDPALAYKPEYRALRNSSSIEKFMAVMKEDFDILPPPDDKSIQRQRKANRLMAPGEHGDESVKEVRGWYEQDKGLPARKKQPLFSPEDLDQLQQDEGVVFGRDETRHQTPGSYPKSPMSDARRQLIDNEGNVTSLDPKPNPKQLPPPSIEESLLKLMKADEELGEGTKPFYHPDNTQFNGEMQPGPNFPGFEPTPPRPGPHWHDHDKPGDPKGSPGSSQVSFDILDNQLNRFAEETGTQVPTIRGQTRFSSAPSGKSGEEHPLVSSHPHPDFAEWHKNDWAKANELKPDTSREDEIYDLNRQIKMRTEQRSYSLPTDHAESTREQMQIDNPNLQGHTPDKWTKKAEKEYQKEMAEHKARLAELDEPDLAVEQALLKLMKQPDRNDEIPELPQRLRVDEKGNPRTTWLGPLHQSKPGAVSIEPGHDAAFRGGTASSVHPDFPRSGGGTLGSVEAMGLPTQQEQEAWAAENAINYDAHGNLPPELEAKLRMQGGAAWKPQIYQNSVENALMKEEIASRVQKLPPGDSPRPHGSPRNERMREVGEMVTSTPGIKTTRPLNVETILPPEPGESREDWIARTFPENPVEEALLKLMKADKYEENGEGTGYQWRHGTIGGETPDPAEATPPPYHPAHKDNLWLSRIRRQPENMQEPKTYTPRHQQPRLTSYQHHLGRHPDLGDAEQDPTYVAGHMDDEWPHIGEASGGATGQHKGTTAQDSRTKEQQDQQEIDTGVSPEKQKRLEELFGSITSPDQKDEIEELARMFADEELGGHPPELWRTKPMGRTDLDPSMQEAVRGRGLEYLGGTGSGVQNSIEKSLLKLMKVDNHPDHYDEDLNAEEAYFNAYAKGRAIEEAEKKAKRLAPPGTVYSSSGGQDGEEDYDGPIQKALLRLMKRDESIASDDDEENRRFEEEMDKIYADVKARKEEDRAKTFQEPRRDYEPMPPNVQALAGGVNAPKESIGPEYEMLEREPKEDKLHDELLNTVQKLMKYGDINPTDVGMTRKNALEIDKANGGPMKTPKVSNLPAVQTAMTSAEIEAKTTPAETPSGGVGETVGAITDLLSGRAKQTAWQQQMTANQMKRNPDAAAGGAGDYSAQPQAQQQQQEQAQTKPTY